MFEGCTLDYIVIKAGVVIPEEAGCFDWATVGTIYLEEGAEIGGIDNITYDEIVEGPKED